ncbi:GTPase Era [Butyrivibrio sp. FC2001]|uniref:GTPase Era n=1 Tax=Butyrivibrio sp. FC2001 TaxID=1280671 RepID=UPI000421BAA9|nr:GTPase Era [Butyrivibrio sp. FC2001]
MQENQNNNLSMKCGYVTLIGRPNVGKSTLMNHLIGQKIAITSHKPQTTRGRIQTVYTDDRGQIVFLDTPGIHESKNKLGEYMVKVATKTMEEVDLILWLVEPSTFIGAGEHMIIDQLRECGKQVILVINKIDTVSGEGLKSFIDAYKKEMEYADIVTVSALKSDNLDELMQRIFDRLPYGDPFYDDETLTDQSERDIVGEIIREKALRLLSDEVPHGIAVTVETMKTRRAVAPAKKKKSKHVHPPKKNANVAAKNVQGSGDAPDLEAMLAALKGGAKDAADVSDETEIMDIEASIICERDSHKGIIIGKGGAMLKKIGSQARVDIEKLVGCKVNLQLFVKVRKDWRNDTVQMKNFGYKNTK